MDRKKLIPHINHLLELATEPELRMIYLLASRMLRKRADNTIAS